MEDFKQLLDEYLRQYPKEENPIFWHSCISEEQIYEALKNRKGGKIILKTDGNIIDSGVLVYEQKIP